MRDTLQEVPCTPLLRIIIYLDDTILIIHFRIFKAINDSMFSLHSA